MNEILTNIRHVLAQIQEDLRMDVENMTGQAVNGENLGRMHGEVCGTIAGLAAVVDKVVQEQQRLEDRVEGQLHMIREDVRRSTDPRLFGGY